MLPSDAGEAVIWKLHGDRQLAMDLLGQEAVTSCEEQLAVGYDTCAVRLLDCATVILTAEVEAELTVVLDAGGCRGSLGEVEWFVLDEEKRLPPRRVP